MNQYIICLIALIGSSSVFSQEAKVIKPISLELSIGYEKNGFNSNYQKHYFWEDGNFDLLSKNANKINIEVKTSLKANKRNTLFFGLGFNVYQAKANNKRILTSFLDLELGHRFYSVTLSKFDIFFENSLHFGFNNDIEKYHLNGIYLIWKPGLHIEKPISQKLNLTIGMNYGLGLNNTSVSELYFLRTKAVGFKIGVKKQL